MSDHPQNITTAELEAALPHLLDAPKDAAMVEQIVYRADYGLRDFPGEIEVTRECGIPGERWGKAPWAKLPDGSPDPGIQVAILNPRLRDLVWRDRENTPHPGDTLTADLDFSEANLPEGQLLSVGSAILRVSNIWNDACVKFKARYGEDAYWFVRKPEHKHLRLRGLLCAVEKDGIIRVGDVIRKT
ncbi:MAG: hypothetical protein AAF826_01110 [Pseudomonadota bacterium]